MSETPLDGGGPYQEQARRNEAEVERLTEAFAVAHLEAATLRLEVERLRTELKALRGERDE